MTFYIVETRAHLRRERRALALAHRFKLVERLCERLLDAAKHLVRDAIARGLHRARQTRENVYVRLARKPELLLHLAQRQNESGDERAVKFVCDFARPLKRNVHVNAPARQTLADATPHKR